MTHIRWESMKPLPDPEARRTQMAYVDGYILACEDVLRDLKEIRNNVRIDQGPKDAEVISRTAHIALLAQVRAKTNESLASARDTMNALRRINNEEGAADAD